MTTKPEQPDTSTSMGRAFVKAFILYILFNGLYLILQPAQNGTLPTLYNGLIPGRPRFEAAFEFNLPRLVDDHIILNATSDTYNIVVLGSSEMWGNQTQPAESIPNVLDSYNFSTAEGKPVRVYNLGFPIPDVFKDLVVAQFVYEQNIPIDLVVVSFNYLSFGWLDYHHITLANQNYAAHVADVYQLDRAALVPEGLSGEGSFWGDREILGRWLTGQFLFPRWWLAGRDRESGDAEPLKELSDLTEIKRDVRPGLIPAFASFREKTGIPVLFMAMPAPFRKNVFRDWLIEQSAQSQLPFLDCSQTFTEPSAYFDLIHILPEMQAPLSRVLARSMSDPALSDVAPGMPLHLAAPLAPEEGTCVFYP